MMKNRIISMTAAVLAVLFLLSSCASIVSRSNYPLRITSKPSDAKVSITDKSGKEIYLGNTPAYLTLKASSGFFSKAEYQVRLSSPGYEDKLILLTASIDGWYFGNILLGGLIGMLIVDPATGAMWKMDTAYLDETLRSTNASADQGIEIYDINNIPEQWKSRLVKLN